MPVATTAGCCRADRHLEVPAYPVHRSTGRGQRSESCSLNRRQSALTLARLQFSATSLLWFVEYVVKRFCRGSIANAGLALAVRYDVLITQEHFNIPAGWKVRLVDEVFDEALHRFRLLFITSGCFSQIQ